VARILIGIFIILHGMVHLLYAGQSLRIFALRSGMAWPDNSWLFSKGTGIERARVLAGILSVLATIGFIISGTGLLLTQSWWQIPVVGSTLLSSLIFILFWDGQLQKLDDQGGFGILINIAIFAAMVIME
jgi:hypothetical protein